MTYTSIPYQTYKNIPLATYGFMGVALFVLAAVSIAEAGEGIASDLSLTSQLPAIFPPSDTSVDTNENSEGNENSDYFSSTVEEQPTETQEYTGGTNEKKKKHKKTRGHKKHRAQSKTHKHKK